VIGGTAITRHDSEPRPSAKEVCILSGIVSKQSTAVKLSVKEQITMDDLSFALLNVIKTEIDVMSGNFRARIEVVTGTRAFWNPHHCKQ